VPGTCEKWGVVKNGGRGGVVCWGGEEKQTHTDGGQTTKKWEADEHAIGRW
jgi:hypothetical protein